MAEKQTYIRQHVDDSEFDGATLDMVRDSLGKNKPQLLQGAAGEFMTAKERLDHLIGVLDKHLAELDKHWTGSDDSRVVKAQLRRLRDSAHSVSTVISDQPPGAQQHPVKASGVAPALAQQGLTLAASRSDVPDSPKRDVSILEGAMQGAEGGGGVGAGVGATIGFFGGAGVGALPAGAAGAVIGGFTGAVAGGVTAAFTDGPFANLFGDSKEEQDRKRAKEHIKKLSEATKANNDAFPASLRTDIPEFDMAPVDLPNSPFNRQGPTTSGIPAGIDQPPYDPSALSGPKLNGFGYPDVNTDGFNGDQVPGYGGTTPTGTLPDGSGIGNAGTGLDGTDLNGPDLNSPDSPDLNGAGLTDGSRTAQTGTGGNAPTTALAGVPDPTAANHANTANTAFATNAGYSVSGAGGTGAGGGTGGAGIRGLGGNGMFGAPHGGGAGGGDDKQERERATWLLEDEDVFSSDVSTTSAFIRAEAKKGRR